MSKPEVAVVPEPSVTEAILALAQAIKEGKSQDAGVAGKLDTLERYLLQQEETRPHENVFNPPLISDYNPLGEVKHPRTELKCKMFWVGFKMTGGPFGSETQAEIDLLNRMEPGDYMVTKSDGKKIPFTVEAKYANGSLDALMFRFPCKTVEDRHNHMSKVAYLREALGDVVNVTHADLLAQIAALKAQLEGATV